MSTSMLSAVDALTSAKIPLSTFNDVNGNVAAGHVTLAGVPLSPVSQSNPLPVADGSLAAAIASLATELAGVATTAGQASAQAVLANILTKLNSVNIAGTVAVQDVVAETSLATLTAISSNTSGLATAAGQANMLAQETAVATAAGTLGDTSWNGSGGGSLIAITKAIVSAVQAVTSKLGTKLLVQHTDPLPAGTNTIGAISVNGVVAVQDSATEAALATISASVNGIATVAGTPTDPAWTGTGGSTLLAALKAVYARLSGTLAASVVGSLPSGTNSIGSVSVSNLPATQAVSGVVGVNGTVIVQDVAAEASLSNVASALSGTLLVQQTGSLPSGSNTLGGVQLRNGVAVTQTTLSIIANTDTQILASNVNRKSCSFFVLTSGAVCYINMGGVATVSNGIPFGQGSQFGYGYTWEGSGVPTNSVHLVSPLNATVIVWEGV